MGTSWTVRIAHSNVPLACHAFGMEFSHTPSLDETLVLRLQCAGGEWKEFSCKPLAVTREWPTLEVVVQIHSEASPAVV
jgi:hypothetical protein